MQLRLEGQLPQDLDEPKAKANFQGYVYGGPAGDGPGSNPPTSAAGAGHLMAVNRRDTWSGRTAVHILDGGRGFQAPGLLSVGTWLHPTDGNWMFVGG